MAHPTSKLEKSLDNLAAEWGLWRSPVEPQEKPKHELGQVCLLPIPRFFGLAAQSQRDVRASRLGAPRRPCDLVSGQPCLSHRPGRVAILPRRDAHDADDIAYHVCRAAPALAPLGHHSPCERAWMTSTL
jgi:hypothetical protein